MIFKMFRYNGLRYTSIIYRHLL